MTKIVELYIDLYPSWQDWKDFTPSAHGPTALSLLTTGARRVKISVELPCFGGSADAEKTIHVPAVQVEEVSPSKPSGS